MKVYIVSPEVQESFPTKLPECQEMIILKGVNPKVASAYAQEASQRKIKVSYETHESFEIICKGQNGNTQTSRCIK